MHVPRDPGEWLVMALLMAAFMLGAHALRSHLTGNSNPMHPGLPMTIVGWIVRRLLALGVPVSILGPMMLLTVRGRQTGKARTLPVDVHDVDGGRYLIATHGVGAWVLNLRVAGEGTLTLGRRRVPFRVRELAPEEAAPVMRVALGRLVASSGWRGRGLRANLGVSERPSDGEYATAALDHPVFEVLPVRPADRAGA